MIEADLVARLKATAGVTALAGTRVFPSPAPEGSTLPAVTWQQVSDSPNRVADGVLNLRRTRFQLDCWAVSALAAVNLAAAVRDALDDWESTAVQMCMTVNVTDLYDGSFAPPRWGRALDVEIVHREA